MLAASQQDWVFLLFFFVVVFFFSMRGLYNYHSVANEATGSSTDGYIVLTSPPGPTALHPL